MCIARKYLPASLVIGILFSVSMLAQQYSQKGGEDETGEYIPVEGWPAPFARPGYIQGVQTGIFAESPNRIFIMNRGELKLPEKLPPGFNGSWGSLLQQANTPPLEPRNFILIYDGSGKLIESWTQHDQLFPIDKGSRGPHKVKISPYDPERHVWIIDDGGHQILKFTNDGKKLVLKLGETGVPGNDEKHFARPTDIAWLPDGTFFISDGYINTRVVKFDKSGKFVKAWGSKGNGAGQFNLVHGIDIDRNRRIYVADRGNSRIQIFDEEGKFLDMWPNIRSPYHIMITADQFAWVLDGTTNRFFKSDLNGKLLYAWGVYGYFPGGLWGPHQFSVDTVGNVYVAESWSGRSQKLKPKPSADKSKLISAPLQLTTVTP